MTTPSLPRINKQMDRIGSGATDMAALDGAPSGDYEHFAALVGFAGAAAEATRQSEAFERLTNLSCCVSTIKMLLNERFGTAFADAGRLIVDEYVRADRKHNGNTPYNPQMSDAHRLAILMEEVGEVARCLTPDASTGVGHAGDLEEELIQTAAMAFAWAMRIVDDMEGYSE